MHPGVLVAVAFPCSMGHVTGLALAFMRGVGRVVGILAAMLPARWWPWLDQHVPVSTSAVLSGIMTLLVGAAIGIPGFLAYMQAAISAANASAWEVAQRNADVADVGALLRTAPIAFSALSLPLFLFTTPEGWLTMYLAVSGLVRATAAATGDRGLGDPLLTALDTISVRTRRRTITTVTRVQRETLEGPEMPDRIMSAAQLGVAGADFVIVASRRKPEWDRGTVVLTDDGTAYRVGTIEDRTIAGRLRTLYPLKEHKDFEVFRRCVRYDLPPGRKV